MRSLAAAKTPVITLETLTKQIADRRTSSTYMHEVLPPLLARMAVGLDEGPRSLASMPALPNLVRWYGESALRLAALEPPPEWGAWRSNPSATFLKREATFKKTCSAPRRTWLAKQGVEERVPV